MPRQRKRHIQLTLEQARKPDGRHGGWRPNAGRKKKAGTVSHAARPDDPARFPRHVTLRIADGTPSLAREGVMKVIRAAIRDSQRLSGGKAPGNNGGLGSDNAIRRGNATAATSRRHM